MNVLSLQNVVKAYANHIAVNDVSFDVKAGSIFGLLGPNGAGKTSLIRIITTITAADSGKIFLNDHPLNHLHPNEIGYMPEERGLYWWDKKIGDLSKGMSQKVQFIATVVHDPSLIILDEPFSGLDPINANLIKDEIYQLKEKGASILFSTHRMEQVEEICEDIVLINKGKILLYGGVDKIKNDFKEHLFSVKYNGNLPESISDHNYLIVSKTSNEIVFKAGVDQTSNDLLRNLINSHVNIVSFNEIMPSLNEIFIKIVESNNE